MKKLLLLLLSFNFGNAVTYSVNESQYFKMPPVFHLDDYDSCVHGSGVYCTTLFNFVSDTPNELLNMIQKYSQRRSNYNHSKPLYGICVTKFCKEQYERNKTRDMKLVLEECLNKTMLEGYGLKTRISEKPYCSDVDSKYSFDYGDIAMGMATLLIIAVNLSGSLYDIYISKREEKKGNRFLLCFSIQRNWKKLIQTETDENFKISLRCFNGVRAITIMLVITSHSLIPFFVTSNNPHTIEKLYDNLENYSFLNGHLVVQFYFVMSGFFLTYIASVKNYKTGWKIIPMGIIMRTIRLLPPYAFVLAMASTWLRFADSGPLRNIYIDTAVKDCREKGWRHLIFLNNYFDNSLCMVHTWYLAADMHLYILGLFVYAFFTTAKSKKIVLGLLFVVGLIIPAALVYLKGVDPILLIIPESLRDFQMKDANFNHLYKRSHTNLAGLVVGLAFGYFIYWLNENPRKIEKYKKCVWIYWFIFPVYFGIVFLHVIFYIDTFAVPIHVKAAFAAFNRPVFALIFVIGIFGCFYKLDHTYRLILDWTVWVIPGRVSYSMYLNHFPIIRYIASSTSTPLHFTKEYSVCRTFGIVSLSFLFALPLWLFLEAPIAQMMKTYLNASDHIENEKTENDEMRIEVNKL